VWWSFKKEEGTRTMRKVLVLLTATLMTLSLAGLGLAQSPAAPPPATGTPPTASTPPTTETPAQPVMPSRSKRGGKAEGVRHMAGAVVSVNAETKSLTVQRTGKKKSKEMTFTLTGDAAGHLTDYKPGDSVRVSYMDEAGKLVAQSVTHGKHAGKAGKK
jgi:sulfite reductase alpha subunit-like flavoprotein